MAAAGWRILLFRLEPSRFMLGKAAAIPTEIDMSTGTLRAVATAPLLFLTLAATEVADVSSTATCEDAAWKVYNHCLMTSSSYWDRLLCDYAFEFNMRTCARS
jgi:hypothetical protein